MTMTTPPAWTPQDASNAHLVKHVLKEIGAYPFGPISLENETHYESDEARRMTLHQWVDELSPVNRAALFEITRLLVGPGTAAV